MKRAKAENGNTAANVGFEDKFSAAADGLRNNMDAAEHEHVVLNPVLS